MPIHRLRQYTDQDIVEKAKIVKSIAGLLRGLGLKPIGGNYSNIKLHLQRLKVDTSHWTGQAWNAGAQMKDWSQYSRGKRLKTHLIRGRGHRCEDCKNDQWKDKPIPLETHHIDGDKTNNVPENLQLLCPNCHALTPSYRRPNWLTVDKPPKMKKPRKRNPLADPNWRSRPRPHKRKVTRPTKEELFTLVWSQPSQRIAVQCGVCDTMIGKWCHYYGISKPPRGYWAKLAAGKIAPAEIASASID